MPALVAIMIMVSIGTFSWSSIKALRVHPRSSSIVMLATVATVVYTHNLAIGVLVGVLLSGIFFAGKIAQLFRVTSDISADGRVRTYRSRGNCSMDRWRTSWMPSISVRRPSAWSSTCKRGAYLGHQLGAGAGHGDPEVPPRRGGGRGRRHEPGDRNAGRPAGEHDKPGALDKLTAH
jgi:MFS superfamily sulfate permease-like transporter